MKMKGYRFLKVLKVLGIVAVAIVVFGEVTRTLWNWLMPAIFGLRTLTFAQALGLFVLGKLLFGGFHRHSGGGGWKRHMKQRWEQMTPEERERFRSGMRGRRGCRWERGEETRSEPTHSEGSPVA